MKVIDRLIDRCRGLVPLLPHVREVTFEWIGSSGEDTDYMGRAYGWKKRLEIGLALDADYPLPPGMQGKMLARDMLLFDFGSGRTPGIEVDKYGSRFVCGLPTDVNDNILIIDDWMKMLDRGAPPYETKR